MPRVVGCQGAVGVSSVEFMSLILNSEATGWGAFGGLSVFAVVSVMRGWFIPGRTHDREMATEKRRGDEWKETAEKANDLNGKLVEANEIVKDFFRKVTVNGNRNDSPLGGDSNVV